MLWLPGINEKPYSLVNDSPVMLTVDCVGPFSEAMHALREGDPIWLRGPYGRGFTLMGRRALLVGGGCGTAPLAFLARRAVQSGIEVTAAVGARSEAEIVLAVELASAGAQVSVATDDGSAGHHGLVSALAERLIQPMHPDAIYACGPEPMLHAIVALCRDRGIPCQVSMERVMKCAIGVCGSCEMEGRLVCRDGPVFRGDEIGP
jgi:dihydroorotate dehydrogenase electron transfer subunit